MRGVMAAAAAVVMMETFFPSCSPSCRTFSLRRCSIHLLKRSLLRFASVFSSNHLVPSCTSKCHSWMSLTPQKYPEWLEANKPRLSPEDYQRYEQQAKLMGEICGLFEREEQDSGDKEGTFESIMDLMQKVRHIWLLSRRIVKCEWNQDKEVRVCFFFFLSFVSCLLNNLACECSINHYCDWCCRDADLINLIATTVRGTPVQWHWQWV